MTVVEMLEMVQRELEHALVNLHHGVDASIEQVNCYKNALGQIKAAKTWIKKGEAVNGATL